VGDEKTEVLIKQLKSALDEYNSHNGESLTSVILYMREAQKYLTEHKDSENSYKKLEDLILNCKRKIVENNLRWVTKIARFYTNVTKKYSYYDDFFSEGIIGLLESIERYNPEIGKFSNYIRVSIKQNIRRKIHEILGNIKLPVNFSFHQKKLEYFIKILSEKNKRIPEDEEIAEFSGIPLKRVKDLKKMWDLFYTASLDAKVYGDEEDGCLLDYIDATGSYLTEEENIKQIICQELVNCINELSDKKEKKVLLARLEGKTLREIGLEINRSGERVRQIEEKATAKVEKMESYQRLLPEQKKMRLKFDYPNMVKWLKEELKNNIQWIR
jgi:RNA polymerase sigma factor (sigma-70 family)